jgi:hypothetical protein
MAAIGSDSVIRRYRLNVRFARKRTRLAIYEYTPEANRGVRGVAIGDPWGNGPPGHQWATVHVSQRAPSNACRSSGTSPTADHPKSFSRDTASETGSSLNSGRSEPFYAGGRSHCSSQDGQKRKSKNRLPPPFFGRRVDHLWRRGVVAAVTRNAAGTLRAIFECECPRDGPASDQA